MFTNQVNRKLSTEIRFSGCVAACLTILALLPGVGYGQCCDCDVTGDGAITMVDVASVAGCIGAPAVPPCVEEDLNCDGIVTMLDADAIASMFAGVPPATVGIPAPMPEPGGVLKNRFLSFVIPPAAAATEPFAIRVELAALPPAYAPLVGEYRYVNTFVDATGAPIFICPDDGPPVFTTYACATLGCEPQYEDWATILGGSVLHVTGSAVIPGSTYVVDFRPAGCFGLTDDCGCVSPALPIATTAWGDITSAAFGPPDGVASVLDIPALTNKLKSVPPILPEPRAWLKQVAPTPQIDAITVIDLSDVVNAVVAIPYARPIAACPAPLCP